MIGYSLRRAPGGDRYSMTDRALARYAADTDLPHTLTQAARSAMTDPSGIRTVVDVLFERESNRLRRPVTVRLLGDNSGTVFEAGVDDPATQDVDDLVSTRHNPSRVYGIADVSLLDAGVVAHDRGEGEELPVVFRRNHASGPIVTATLSGNPSGALDPAVANATDPFGFTGRYQLRHEISSPLLKNNFQRSLSPGDAGRILVDEPTVWFTPGFAYSGEIDYVTGTPTRYVVPDSGVLRFTIGFDVATAATDASVAGRVTLATTGTTYGVGVLSEFVDLEANTPTRILTTADLYADPGTIVTNVRPEVYVQKGTEGTSGVRFEIANLQTYVGDPRPFPIGVLSSVPIDTIPGVELVYATPIHANRVEVSGEARGGQVTAARVEVAYAGTPNVWHEAGQATGVGRLSIPLDPTVVSPDDLLAGVRVWIHETTGGDSAPVYVQEVDVLFLDDVSEDVAALDTTWSREADPGTATSPFGNYAASTVNLELDNTSGRWNPATNATLDVGHRIEVGVGVRYGNRLGNPRGEHGIEEWISGHPIEVCSDLPAGAPHSRGFLISDEPDHTFTAPRTASVAVDPDAATVRVGAWVYVARPNPDTPVELTAVLTSSDGATSPSTPAVPTPGSWQYVTTAIPVADYLATPLAYLSLTVPNPRKFTNQALNPGAETNTTSIFRGGSATGPVTRDTTRKRGSGVASARVDVTATGSLITYYGIGTSAGPGDRIDALLWVRPDTASSWHPYLWGPRPSDGVNTAVEIPAQLVACPAGVWTPIPITLTVPADRTVTRVGIRHATPGSINTPAVGFGYNTDDLIVYVNEEEAPVDSWSGDTPDEEFVRYSWTSTPNGSTSVREEAAETYLTLASLEQLDGDGNVLEVEEILPGGVFYSEPYDTDSRSATVSISAVDRLGRLRSVAVDEEVREGHTVGRIVRDLALRYLDLDVDQVEIGALPGGYVIPYAYAAGGDVGSYLADLAKATVSTLHVDALERLRLTRRSDVTDAVVVELRADNALIGHRTPPGIDVTTSVVTVNASPLVLDAAPADLWTMPPGGIVIPQGATHDLVAVYTSPPATDVSLSGIVADGDYEIVGFVGGSHRARVKIRNDEARPLVVADLHVVGTPLVSAAYTARVEHDPSVARYGPRELTIDARLIQTPDQAEAVANVLLDTFRSLDDDGVRRIPDLTVDALGILCLEAGDRVTVSHPEAGVGGDYTALSRRLVYQGGGVLLANDLRLREAVEGIPFAIVGESQADTGALTGY